MVEAKNALLSAWLNLWGRGYVVGWFTAPGLHWRNVRLNVRVSEDGDGGWCVDFSDWETERISVSVRHPLGNVLGDRRLRIPEEVLARERRWVKALLATFAHPRMFDADAYTSRQGIDIVLVDATRPEPDTPFMPYLVLMHWQKAPKICLTKEFYLSETFEVLKVETSGICPACGMPVPIGGAYTTFGTLRELDRYPRRQYLQGVSCPNCESALDAIRAYGESAESIVWYVRSSPDDSYPITSAADAVACLYFDQRWFDARGRDRSAVGSMGEGRS